MGNRVQGAPSFRFEVRREEVDAAPARAALEPLRYGASFPGNLTLGLVGLAYIAASHAYLTSLDFKPCCCFIQGLSMRLAPGTAQTLSPKDDKLTGDKHAL